MAPPSFICLFSLRVCPNFTTYISITMGGILMKLGKNAGSYVKLIVLKFQENLFSNEVIITSFLIFSYFMERNKILR